MATSAQLSVELVKAQEILQSLKNDLKSWTDSYNDANNKLITCSKNTLTYADTIQTYTCSFDGNKYTITQYNDWVNQRSNAQLNQNLINAKIADVQAKVDAAQKAYNDQIKLESNTNNTNTSTNTNTTSTVTPISSTTKAIIWSVLLAGIALTVFIVWYKRKNK